MYRVIRPIFERTGETTMRPDGTSISWERVSKWVDLGIAESMEDAKEKFGGSPVLEHIRNVH